MERRIILVPLDISGLAECALPYAETLAVLYSAEIRLLSVVGRAGEVILGDDAAIRHRVSEELLHAAERYLAGVADALQQRGLTVSLTLAVGHVAEAIVTAAAQPNVATVVVATHGRSGAARLVLGSVADKVMRLATCPTLLVHGEEAAGGRPPAVVRRIMVPLDGSVLAEAALVPATEVAQAAHATLVLVRAEPSRWELPEGYEYVPDLPALDARMAEAAENYLANVRTRLPMDMDVELVVERGLALRALEVVLRRESIDLVVMATHGRGGLGRLVLGSTAERMVRLSPATLLVRPMGAERENTITAVTRA